MLYKCNMDKAGSLVYNILLYNWTSLVQKENFDFSSLCDLSENDNRVLV